MRWLCRFDEFPNNPMNVCKKLWFWMNTSPHQRQLYAKWPFILILTNRPNGKDYMAMFKKLKDQVKLFKN